MNKMDQKYAKEDHNPIKLKEKVYLTPTFYTWSTSPPNYKTVCFTPWTFQNRLFYPPGGFWQRVATVTTGLLHLTPWIFTIVQAYNN